jgi:acetyl-CoA synthetase
MQETEQLDVLLKEEKIYQPPKNIVDKANAKNYDQVRIDAIKGPEKFWESAAEELFWHKKWTQVLDHSKKPFFNWFANAKCNIVFNAIDRHLKTSTKNKLALVWEGEPGDARKLTYAELNSEVCKFANVLKKLGIKKGDKVTTYLPNIPEQAITMLACAKIGAIHSVVYAGFSAEALKERMNDAESKIVVTADGSYRNGKTIPLKEMVGEAVSGAPTIKNIIIVKRAGREVVMGKNELWWHELMNKASDQCETEVMNADDPLFILYTSGTTGKPKGIVHVHGGYMVGVSRTLKWVFDIKENDIFWCTADPGWITGHSYAIYAPLILGTTSVLYESVPTFPNPDRWWDVIEKYGITIFYTAPTVIRSIMKLGDEWVDRHAMKSLRLLGSVGEPINPEVWEWYYKHVGKDRCPIMDTWWQTETGAYMITPVPTMPLKPGSATKPFAGIEADILDNDGHPVPPGKGGFLVIKTPWPAMLKTIYKDSDRYKKTYWERFPGVYLTGDVARRDEDGYFWLEGRADDVIKIAGHRIGTAEIESAFVSHAAIAEAAVIGIPDAIKGQVAKAFLILKKGVSPSDQLRGELKLHIKKELGPIAIIGAIEFVDSLPKTRSGKIMRRVLKAKELGLDLGDLSTLES